jgi:hypothetical protein
MQSLATTTLLKRPCASLVYTTRSGGGGGTISTNNNMWWMMMVVTRCKHSNTQLNRLFKKHPARQRVWERLGKLPKIEPPPTPTYPAIVEVKQILSNGWIPPPPSDLTVPTYPFAVTRTKNKPNDAAGFLPVYSHIRKDRSLTTTRIRKVTGDQQAFIQELRAVLQIPIPSNPNDDPIRIRSGCIEIKGNHVRNGTCSVVYMRWLCNIIYKKNCLRSLSLSLIHQLSQTV